MPLLEELYKIRSLNRIYLIDNSPVESEELLSLPLPVVYIFNNANLGYGRAHNIAIRESIYDEIDYHLVINSDIEVKATDITTLLDFIEQHHGQSGIIYCLLQKNSKIQEEYSDCIDAFTNIQKYNNL